MLKQQQKQLRMQIGDASFELDENIEQQQEYSQQQRNKRKSSSLGLVTQKFVQLIRRCKNMTICLNDAMSQLKLKKRRLYDIANVLEGIGYVKKVSRNHLKWIGGGQDPLKAVQIHFLKDYFQELKKDERKINQKIQDTNRILRKCLDQHNQQNFYISQDDCQIIKNSHGNDTTLLLLQVPKGTQMWSIIDKNNGQTTLKIDTKNQQYKVYLSSPGQQLIKYNSISQI